MCSAKSKNRGKRREKAWNYSPTYNWKIADRRRFERMDADRAEAGV